MPDFLDIYDLQVQSNPFSVAYITTPPDELPDSCKLPPPVALPTLVPINVTLPDLACKYGIDTPIFAPPYFCPPNISGDISVTYTNINGGSAAGSATIAPAPDTECDFILGGNINIDFPCVPVLSVDFSVETGPTSGTTPNGSVTGDIVLQGDTCNPAINGDIVIDFPCVPSLTTDITIVGTGSHGGVDGGITLDNSDPCNLALTGRITIDIPEPPTACYPDVALSVTITPLDPYTQIGDSNDTYTLPNFVFYPGGGPDGCGEYRLDDNIDFCVPPIKDSTLTLYAGENVTFEWKGAAVDSQEIELKYISHEEDPDYPCGHYELTEGGLTISSSGTGGGGVESVTQGAGPVGFRCDPALAEPAWVDNEDPLNPQIHFGVYTDIQLDTLEINYLGFSGDDSGCCNNDNAYWQDCGKTLHVADEDLHNEVAIETTYASRISMIDYDSGGTVTLNASDGIIEILEGTGSDAAITLSVTDELIKVTNGTAFSQMQSAQVTVNDGSADATYGADELTISNGTDSTYIDIPSSGANFQTVSYFGDDGHLYSQQILAGNENGDSGDTAAFKAVVKTVMQKLLDAATITAVCNATTGGMDLTITL